MVRFRYPYFIGEAVIIMTKENQSKLSTILYVLIISVIVCFGVSKLLIALGCKAYIQHLLVSYPSQTLLGYVLFGIFASVTVLPEVFVGPTGLYTIFHAALGFEKSIGVSFIISVCTTIITYLIGRYWSKTEFIDHLLNTHLKKYTRVGKRVLTRNWLLTVLFIFGTKYNFISYLAGVSRVRFMWLFSTFCLGRFCQTTYLTYRDTLIGVNDIQFNAMHIGYVATAMVISSFMVLLSLSEYTHTPLKEFWDNPTKTLQSLLLIMVPNK